MRGDYSSETDDQHFERIKPMEDKMVDLLVKRRVYRQFAKSKIVSHANRYGSIFSKDKVENEIDELREEMRQQ